MEKQNNILKKKNPIFNLHPNKLKVTINTKKQCTNKTSMTLFRNDKISSVENEKKLIQAEPLNAREINVQNIEETKLSNIFLSSTENDFKSEETKEKSTLEVSGKYEKKQNNPKSKKETDGIQTIDEVHLDESYMMLLKPPPKLSDPLLAFLSKDLVKKSLEVCIIEKINFSIMFYLRFNMILKIIGFCF